jgi:hypothetical protein
MTLQEVITALQEGDGHLKRLQGPLTLEQRRQFLQQLRRQFSLWQEYARHSRQLAALLEEDALALAPLAVFWPLGAFRQACTSRVGLEISAPDDLCKAEIARFQHGGIRQYHFRTRRF